MLVAGLLIAVTSGLAFSAVLKEAVNDWYKKRSTRSISKLQGLDVQLPFAGICLGRADGQWVHIRCKGLLCPVTQGHDG